MNILYIHRLSWPLFTIFDELKVRRPPFYSSNIVNVSAKIDVEKAERWLGVMRMREL